MVMLIEQPEQSRAPSNLEKKASGQYMVKGTKPNSTYLIINMEANSIIV